MLRIVKRAELPAVKSGAIRIISILAALLVCAIFIYASTGHNPLEVYSKMLEGSFGTRYRFSEAIVKTIPLVIASLGIAAAFKMKFWNIGAEGQICMGAFAASAVAFSFPNLPSVLLLFLMAAAGVIGGGLWALMPAFFKAIWKTNETIVTLMLNYVALKFITYLQYGPWRDPKATGFPKIANFADAAVLPKVLGIHLGWVIALMLVIVMYIFMKHSKLGYEIAVIGESENTARYAGINIQRTIIIVMLVSGGLCGLTGMIQASAVSNNLNIDVSGGVGYTAIITTWLAGLSAPLIALVSFLFAVLVQGASYIQTAFNIPSAIAEMLQGIILFFVLGSEFFTRYTLMTKNKLERLIQQEIQEKQAAACGICDGDKNLSLSKEGM